VIKGDTPADRDADVHRLLASGEARLTDWFIHTGVQRSLAAFGRWQEVVPH